MPLTMPCISLHQPWASLIGNGKLFETRSWPTNHRGLLAIHAAKRFTPEARALLETEPFRTSLLPMVQDTLTRPELFAWALERALPFGKIVAVCRLADCQEIRPNYGPADGKPFRDKKRQPRNYLQAFFLRRGPARDCVGGVVSPASSRTGTRLRRLRRSPFCVETARTFAS